MLFGRYAYETPPCQARCSVAPPHHFAVAMPTKPRSAERIAPPHPPITLQALRLRISAMPKMLLCGLAGSGLVLYAIAPPPTTFTFIPLTPPISLSRNFSFQVLDWPVGSDSLKFSPHARVGVSMPPGRTRGHGPGIKSQADSRIQQRRFNVVMAVSLLHGCLSSSGKNKGICSFFRSLCSTYSGKLPKDTNGYWIPGVQAQLEAGCSGST